MAASIKPMPFTPHRLTRTQWAVVAHLYRDEMDYALTADSLGIRERTVRAHVARIASSLPGSGPSAWRVLRWAESLLALGHDGDERNDEHPLCATRCA